jgi:multicomponent Na+:H+ antiporter subunit C
MVMPTVQALTLTAIVIGLATMALLLTMAIIIYRNYGTLNTDRINKLKG